MVVIRNEAVIGLALGHGEPWTDGLHFYLNELCIDPTEQREGVGKALLAKLMETLRSRGISSVFLLTEVSSVAESFFLNQGFEVESSSVKLWKEV